MITEARAKRIAKELNDMRGGSLAGGFLAYDRDGNGGQWYSADTYGVGDVVTLTVRDARKPRWTAEDVLAVFAAYLGWK